VTFGRIDKPRFLPVRRYGAVTTLLLDNGFFNGAVALSGSDFGGCFPPGVQLTTNLPDAPIKASCASMPLLARLVAAESQPQLLLQNSQLFRRCCERNCY
jgi:hypothetical protein